MTSRLHVALANDLAPPTAAHSLLLSFYFGATPPAEDHPALVSTRLLPVDQDTQFENWWVEDDIEFSNRGSVRIAECADYAVVIYENDESTGDDFQAFSCAAYRELLDAVQSTGHAQPVKVWNYLGGINDGEGDQERYRQFSCGRAMAFSEAGVRDDDAPTGTGIGTRHTRGLTIIALCSRHPFALTENPRQMSAFHYPRQYGPRSPKFARGGLLETDHHCLHLISGTAAIVGHESMHPDDTPAQLDETLRNLDALCGALPNIVLDERWVLRVYLRNPNDYLAIAKRLRERLGPGADQVTFLHGNICRRELSVEIDGARIR